MFRVLIAMFMLLVAVACEEVDPEECIKDVECARREFKIDAEVACEVAVENRAVYAVRWTDGWAESKFYSFFPRTAAKEIILAGNKAQFQNGFGAWQNVRYSCVYDPVNQRVKSVKVE